MTREDFILWGSSEHKALLGGTLLMLLPPAPHRPSETETTDWENDRGREYHKGGEELLHHKSFRSKPKALIRNKRNSRGGVSRASQRRVAKAPYELTGKLRSNTSNLAVLCNVNSMEYGNTQKSYKSLLIILMECYQVPSMGSLLNIHASWLSAQYCFLAVVCIRILTRCWMYRL